MIRPLCLLQAHPAVGGSSGVAGDSIYGVSVGGGGSAGVQDLQERRMSVWASGEDPAKKRDTIGDKVGQWLLWCEDCCSILTRPATVVGRSNDVHVLRAAADAQVSRQALYD